MAPSTKFPLNLQLDMDVQRYFTDTIISVGFGGINISKDLKGTSPVSTEVFR